MLLQSAGDSVDLLALRLPALLNLADAVDTDLWSSSDVIVVAESVSKRRLRLPTESDFMLPSSSSSSWYLEPRFERSFEWELVLDRKATCLLLLPVSLPG